MPSSSVCFCPSRPSRARRPGRWASSGGEPRKSPDGKERVDQGIYKFDEQTLKICFSDGEAGRPKEFKTDFGKSFAFDLKRKK